VLHFGRLKFLQLYIRDIYLLYIGVNLSKNIRKTKEIEVAQKNKKEKRKKITWPFIWGPAHAPPLLLRSAEIFCSFPNSQARRRLPLPPLASLAPSPPSSAHRPATLCTHLPLPSRLCCTVGARPAAQGGRALAPPGYVRITVGLLDNY